MAADVARLIEEHIPDKKINLMGHSMLVELFFFLIAISPYQLTGDPNQAIRPRDTT